MYKLKQWIYRFMQGRYGADELYRFSFIVFIVLLVLSMIFKGTLGFIFSLAETAVLIFSIYRAFSRNIAARSAENRKFLMLRDSAGKTVKRNVNRVKDIKTKRYRKCPNCKTWVRLPIKKGTHHVNCPSCKQQFEVRIRF